MSHAIRPPDWLPFAWQRRKRWAMKLLDDFICGIIRQRRASGEDRGDLLSMLLLAVDEEGEGGGMTDEQARSEAMTLLLAGHDTTAAGLTWIFYLLAQHPEVESRVIDELEQVLGGRPPTAADVPRLAYTERVIKEALRLYPPAIAVVARQAAADVEIGGYLIPKGSIVRAFSYILQHDARWFPDPERFDPERFAPGNVEKIPQFAYFPFGGGPRVCVGNTFAMMEMTLVTATILQRCRLNLSPTQGPVELLQSMSLRPRGGLQMTVAPRTPVTAGAQA
jgi:cytochrome P450